MVCKTSTTASALPGNQSVYPHHRLRRDAAERLDAADAIPGIFDARFLALALVAFQETRDEQLLRQRRQHDPARLTVVHHLVRAVEIDHLRDGARLRSVIGD